MRVQAAFAPSAPSSYVVDVRSCVSGTFYQPSPFIATLRYLALCFSNPQLFPPPFIPDWRGASFRSQRSLLFFLSPFACFREKSYVSDATAAIIICFSMFVFPSERPEVLGGPRRKSTYAGLPWLILQFICSFRH